MYHIKCKSMDISINDRFYHTMYDSYIYRIFYELFTELFIEYNEINYEPIISSVVVIDYVIIYQII